MNGLNDVKVSVLVTFYNQEKYVDKALSSVFSQITNFDYEVIVGDDGSSDNTVFKVEQWMKKYPRLYMYSMERTIGEKYIAGFRASRNRINLLRYVKGEYFIYLDGDDYFTDPHKLQKQVDVLDNKINADCVICAHKMDVLENGVRVEVYPSKEIAEGKYDLKIYWRELYFHTDSMLIRSNVIGRIPVDLVEESFNDNMITYVMLQFGKIYYLPDSMAVYLKTGDGVWTSSSDDVRIIRSLIGYDIYNQLNPSMKHITDKRYCWIWSALLSNRKKIDSKELGLIANVAIEKNLEQTIEWIHYNEYSFLKRVRLYLSVYWKQEPLYVKIARRINNIFTGEG